MTQKLDNFISSILTGPRCHHDVSDFMITEVPDIAGLRAEAHLDVVPPPHVLLQDFGLDCTHKTTANVHRTSLRDKYYYSMTKIHQLNEMNEC